MRAAILSALALFGTATGYSGEDKSDQTKFTSKPALHMDEITSFSFACGKGFVEVNLKTGAVSFRNCTPEESGKAFWQSVTKEYPEIKRAIRDGRE